MKIIASRYSLIQTQGFGRIRRNVMPLGIDTGESKLRPGFYFLYRTITPYGLGDILRDT